jgi:hypothetical protein
MRSSLVTALNNFSNALQMGLGIEPDFEPPSVFQENKMHLPATVHRPHVASGLVPVPGIAQDPDARLVARAQGGNLEAFEELIRRHSQLIYRTLMAILGNPADA